MAKISQKIIKLDSSVKAEAVDGKIKVTGPKGELSLSLPKEVKVSLREGSINLELGTATRALFGLYAALIHNLVTGVTTGFRKDLEMVGIGYKAKKEGRDLILTIGFSHPVRYTPPGGTEISVVEDVKISVAGIDKELVGQVASEIKKLKKPEPYKGKGIKYLGEVVKRKAGKAGKVGTAK